jgi:hypothetical protein
MLAAGDTYRSSPHKKGLSPEETKALRKEKAEPIICAISLKSSPMPEQRKITSTDSPEAYP